MEKSRLILGDAADYSIRSDLILTDPPYEMSGAKLANIINAYDSNHLVLISTMSQLLEFSKNSKWSLCFDFIIDGVSPKRSMSLKQPHYTHQIGVYMRRNNVHSIFDRKRRKRSDVFQNNGYWPTLFHAPRSNSGGYAKNINAITDILGSFDSKSVVDPFAGTGTTAWAALDVGMKFVGIEKDSDTFDKLANAFEFVGNMISIER